MRTTVSLLLGLLLLVSAPIVVTAQIKLVSEDLLVQLSTVEQSVLDSQWVSASDELNENYSKWEIAKKWLAVVINHNTLNSIEICYLRLEQFCLEKDSSLARAELKTLMVLISDIPESESLRLQNVL